MVSCALVVKKEQVDNLRHIQLQIAINRLFLKGEYSNAKAILVAYHYAFLSRQSRLDPGIEGG